MSNNTLNVKLSETDLKYLKMLVRLKSVNAVAREVGLSERSVGFYLKSAEWALQAADCFE